MADRASSDNPAVQAQLDRLALLSPGRDILGLERDLGPARKARQPGARLPPVFHVAGTNGKGSTCAFLRAALEAAGLTVHAYTSPHLVRFNERIRLAGRLIDDEALAALLAETLDAAGGMELSFFEATTAAAFLAFSRAPADACIVEVGLGGRLDATNVVPAPLACGIAAARPRPSRLPRQHARGDRGGESGHRQAGRAARSPSFIRRRWPRGSREAARAAGARWLPRGGALGRRDPRRQAPLSATRAAASICHSRASPAPTRR